VLKCEVEFGVPNMGDYLVTLCTKNVIVVKDEMVARLAASHVYEDDLYGSIYENKKETLGV